MTQDSAHQAPFPPFPSLPTQYGPQVHIVSHALASTLLARLSSPACIQPEINSLIRACYRILTAAVVQDQFPSCVVAQESRMAQSAPEGCYSLRRVDPSTRVAIAAVARAGTLPSYEMLAQLAPLLATEQVRIDHVFMNRRTDADGTVVGVDVSGSKIGGSVEGAMLLVPDPMGATGGSLCETLRIYQDQVPGTPLKQVAMHLIITPEYIGRVLQEQPQTQIYSLRLDRGLSTEEALSSQPGAHPDQERGLNENQYILPGAGGLGEIMNNSFV